MSVCLTVAVVHGMPRLTLSFLGRLRPAAASSPTANPPTWRTEAGCVTTQGAPETYYYNPSTFRTSSILFLGHLYLLLTAGTTTGASALQPRAAKKAMVWVSEKGHQVCEDTRNEVRHSVNTGRSTVHSEDDMEEISVCRCRMSANIKQVLRVSSNSCKQLIYH